MQSTIVAGDSLDFLTQVPDYPATDGWTLKYRLIPRVSGTPITLTASASGADYRTQVAPATTDDWIAGEYSLAAWVEKTGARYSVEGIALDEFGRPIGKNVTILPDPAVAAAWDSRSFARKALDSIEAVLQNRATIDQEEYAINGRSLKRTPTAELYRLRMRFLNEVRNEEARQRLADGMGGAPRILVRF